MKAGNFRSSTNYICNTVFIKALTVVVNKVDKHAFLM